MKDQQSNLETVIPVEWRERTLDSFLRQALGLSRSRIRALKKIDGIWLDGHPVWVNYRLYGGEHLVLQIVTPGVQTYLVPEALPLSILYEDQDLIVLDKPAGMVVHPVKKHQSGTLANALMYHWRNQPDSASFHPVHRLDRLTSGAILIAKNSWAHQQLDRQLAAGDIKRIYFAVCQGHIHPAGAKICAPILSHPETPKREIHADGKPAATRYHRLHSSPAASLLAVKLFTGRTHQIRVHLAYLGHPLWGDALYGQTAADFPRPALHSAKLSFWHPRTGQLLKFKAPLPEDLGTLIDNLGLEQALRFSPFHQPRQKVT